MDPMGTIDSIYKKYYTLICTKYESYGPFGLETFFFNLMQSFPHLNDALNKI